MAICFGRVLLIIIILKFAPECTSFQNKFYRSKSKALTAYNRTLTTLSKIGCSVECARDRSCRSASYRETTRECMLSDLPSFVIDLYGHDDLFLEVFGTTEWTLVYRGIPRIGSNPATAWLTGESVTSDPACQQLGNTSCNKHFRHSIASDWSSLNIEQVKIAFYKGSLEQNITFDGRNSTISNWFSQSRILSSTWPGVRANASFNRFKTIDGTRVFVVSPSHSTVGCHDDLHFAAVIATSGWCAYDRPSAYPQIYFATGEHAGKPETMTGMDIADGFAIFIK
ncbi:hypothetical protein DPMN_098810 [Dreissena polymorpha]|uniref:Apple domain-containing protein n=1 Tax=Dreissena polymorpha TaxID=45954 RepID=A0A9D4LFZ4_DREPO|nr:hypothetical protein DPMN_098810 [Dreissena polymorpha]